MEMCPPHTFNYLHMEVDCLNFAKLERLYWWTAIIRKNFSILRAHTSPGTATIGKKSYSQTINFSLDVSDEFASYWHCLRNEIKIILLDRKKGAPLWLGQDFQCYGRLSWQSYAVEKTPRYTPLLWKSICCCLPSPIMDLCGLFSKSCNALRCK